MDDIEEKCHVYNISHVYPKSDKMLNSLIKDLNKLMTVFVSSIETEDINQFPKLLKEIHKFKSKIDKSELLKLLMTRELSKYGPYEAGSSKALKMQAVYDKRLKEFREGKDSDIQEESKVQEWFKLLSFSPVSDNIMSYKMNFKTIGIVTLFSK